MSVNLCQIQDSSTLRDRIVIKLEKESKFDGMCLARKEIRENYSANIHGVQIG